MSISKVRSERRHRDPPGSYYAQVAPSSSERPTGGDSDGGGIILSDGDGAHQQEQMRPLPAQEEDPEEQGIIVTAEVVNVEEEQERFQRMAEEEAQRRIDPDLQRRVIEAESTLDQLERQPTVHAIQVVAQVQDDSSHSQSHSNEMVTSATSSGHPEEGSSSSTPGGLPKLMNMVSARRGSITIGVLAILLLTAAIVIGAVIGTRDSPSSASVDNQGDTGLEGAISSTPSPVPIQVPGQDTSNLGNSLAGVVAREDDLSTLQTCMERVGSFGFLEDPESDKYTLFAPTDAAFADFDQALLTKLLQPEWKVHLEELLQYHVSNGQTLIGDITDEITLRTQTWPFEQLLATVTETGEVSLGSGPFAGTFKGVFSGSKVVQADILADNGVVHKVDQVFLPTVLTLNLLEAADELNPIFRELVVTAGIDERMSTDTLTLFGPWYTALENFFADHPGKRSDPEFVKTLMEHHALEGVFYAESFPLGQTTLTNIAGNTLTIEKTMVGRFPEWTVNGVALDFVDGIGINGFIHVARDVIVPDGLV